MRKNQWATRKKVPHTEQLNQYECGISCLHMVLSYYKYDIKITELRNHFGNGRDGSSLLKIKQTSKLFNLDSAAKRLSINEIQTMKLPLPAIAYFENNHFVVLEKISKGIFFIVDPTLGRTKMSFSDFKMKYSEILLFLWPNDNFKIKKKERNLDFPKQVWKFKSLLFSLMLFSLILQIIAISVPIAIKEIIDKVVTEEKHNLYIFFLLIFIGIILFQIFFNTLKNYFLILLQNKLDVNLMNRFFSHLFKLPYSFFETRSKGDLIFRANSNIQIREFLSQQLISSLINIFLVIFIFIYMMIESKVMALSILGVGVIQMLTISLSRSSLRYLTQSQVSNQAETSSFMTEILGGMSTIKSLGIEDYIYKKWDDIYGRQIKATKRQEIFKLKLDIVIEALNFLAPLLVICIGIVQIQNGEITLGALFAFQALAMSFLSPLSSLANLITDIISIETLLERIYDVLQTKPEDLSKYKENIILKGGILLNNISFKYNNFGEDILKNIYLKVEPGQNVAIVGKSGSGKSTLASLLVGLYSPTKGKIYFDDYNYKNLDKVSLRKQIGVVLQENFLFNKSIFDNITIHHPEATIDEVISVAKIAAIHQDISSLPMGYETIISEDGSNFSGGQRQRIALARSLITKPSILLLDEATSALDSITESKIETNIENLNCTRIVIAHRLSTIKNADLIVVMENGEIIAKGTHDELMYNSEYYSELYKTSISEKRIQTNK